MKKAILAMLVVAGVVLFFGMDLDQYLTLGELKENQGRFAHMLEQHPWHVTLIAFALYLIVVALSLPGATIMGLAAGALFGFWYGAIFVAIASSVGATLAFLISRYLLRDVVQHRFGDKLKGINDGMARDGALYLLVLRLVPVFPFFLINLLMGLTPIHTRTFFWISLLGMLPAIMVVVNAGAQLARVNGMSDIFSPEIILSFALLGVFPLLAKWIAQAIRK